MLENTKQDLQQLSLGELVFLHCPTSANYVVCSSGRSLIKTVLLCTFLSHSVWVDCPNLLDEASAMYIYQ